LSLVKLENDSLCLSFDPKQGGKWRSLVDLETGYEWWWQNPSVAVAELAYGDSFIEKHDTGGWDELPSRSERWAIKLFSEEGEIDHIELCYKNGSRLSMSWNAEENPYLGLWISNGA